jgi:hypothetical protein
VTLPAPRIDSRTSDEIVRQTLELLKAYIADWSSFDPVNGWSAFDPGKGASHALLNIFGRFSELIIERLNHVPEKNLLAFLDMIGASLLPPEPARVPLTFSLVNGSIVDGLVPAGTQVAAVPAEGEAAPVVFETEDELIVTAAQLTSLFMRQPEQGKYADNSLLINSATSDGVPAYLGNRKLENIFYLGHATLFSYPRLRQLQVDFQASQPPASFRTQWERWDGAQWKKIPASVTAGGRETADGKEYLTKDGHLYFTDIPPSPRQSIAGFEKSWLRCRLLTPITPAIDSQLGTISNDQLPLISSIAMTATIGTEPEQTLAIEAAFSNTMQVNPATEFLPFGEKPKIEDTLYLANREAFSQQDAVVTLNLNLGTPGLKTGKARLSWEFWDGRMWSALDKNFSDSTSQLTADSKSGDIRFTFPGQPVMTNVGGVDNFWIRARLVSGNYGEEARYEAVDKAKPEKGYQFVSQTFQPPTITSIKVAYSLTKSSPPEVVLSYNDELDYEVCSYPFKPFEHQTDINPTLYFGFSLPAGLNTFPNRKLSLYAALAEFKQGENLIPISPDRSRSSGKSTDNPTSIVTHTFIITNPTSETVNYLCEATGKLWPPNVMKTEISVEAGKSKELPVMVTIPGEAKEGMRDRGFLTLRPKADPAVEYNAIFDTYVGATIPSSEQLELVWQYSTGTTWSELSVRDHSENLTRAGLIEFLAPTDFKEGREFGLPRYWLRAIWKSGEYQFDPRLRGLLLNTTMGAQAVTIKDETLGSSDGSKNQKFQTTRTPILEGHMLDVREPEIPPVGEQEKLTAGGVGNALRVVVDDTGRPKEIWVRWRQVADFYGSGPRDRHYVLDHLTGEVRFGDGQNGLIPPTGAGNILMSLYRNGGGATGNKPAGTITQLKTTVPYVEKVVNYLAAAGGTDAETKDSLLNRAPRMLRHGMRAVTVKDYEDMAMLASTEVARAKCIPLVNIITDAEGGDKRLIRNGTVSLIIVPRSIEAKPSPGFELLGRVQDFVGQLSSPVAELVVAGPKYVRINVTVEVALTSLDGASEIKLAIAQALSNYLHPLTGGPDGTGWAFGRYPHESNLYALIEGIADVDHVTSLTFSPTEESDEVRKAGKYFLVYSGTHTINLRFEEG